jgi:hypothetical protein
MRINLKKEGILFLDLMELVHAVRVRAPGGEEDPAGAGGLLAAGGGSAVVSELDGAPRRMPLRRAFLPAWRRWRKKSSVCAGNKKNLKNKKTGRFKTDEDRDSR